jgi:hypothetical protein
MPWAGFTALLPLRVRSVRKVCLAPLTGRAPLGLCPLQGFPLPLRCHGSSPLLLPCAYADVRSARLPRRSVRLLRYGVSLASVVALPLSRPPYPHEVSGHLVLTIRRRRVLAYCFASGFR